MEQNGLPEFQDMQSVSAKLKLERCVWNFESCKIFVNRPQFPVPEIIYFDTTFNNELGAPFSIATWLEGIPLYKAWRSYDSLRSRDQRRRRILESLADAMVQLKKWSFSHIKLPEFQNEDSLSEVVEALCVRDAPKEFDLLSYGVEETPVCFYEDGPFDSTADYLRSLLNRCELRVTVEMILGQRKMLHIMINAVGKCESNSRCHKPQRFVLKHPDLDVQNILVSKDGTVSGIIDWDGIQTVPMQLGYAKYPLWIMRDWNPDAYFHWSPDEESRLKEDTPAQLARYRRWYHEIITDRLGESEDAISTINSHVF